MSKLVVASSPRHLTAATSYASAACSSESNPPKYTCLPSSPDVRLPTTRATVMRHAAVRARASNAAFIAARAVRARATTFHVRGETRIDAGARPRATTRDFSRAPRAEGPGARPGRRVPRTRASNVSAARVGGAQMGGSQVGGVHLVGAHVGA